MACWTCACQHKLSTINVAMRATILGQAQATSSPMFVRGEGSGLDGVEEGACLAHEDMV